MLEVCIAATLLALVASAGLGGTLLAQREATLAALRQNAIALAEERRELLASGTTDDIAGWQARVAAALPGGEGTHGGGSVQVRWRTPGVTDGRCPGATCVVLGMAP